MLVDETAEPKDLPLSLLEDITGGFSDDQEIGRGGFAVVYKVYIHDTRVQILVMLYFKTQTNANTSECQGILGSRAVAVKRLTNVFMDEKRFHQEVVCLMQVKHKNVVRFLGYCADRQGNMQRYMGNFVMADVHDRLLCFEYISKGSLDKYITGMTILHVTFSLSCPLLYIIKSV
jgi:serine/threonine protein kinase